MLRETTALRNLLIAIRYLDYFSLPLPQILYQKLVAAVTDRR